MPIGTLTLMHGLLMYLLRECLLDSNIQLAQKYDCESYTKQCEDNSRSGMQTYEIMVVPPIDNTEALLIGVCLPRLILAFVD